MNTDKLLLSLNDTKQAGGVPISIFFFCDGVHQLDSGVLSCLFQARQKQEPDDSSRLEQSDIHGKPEWSAVLTLVAAPSNFDDAPRF